MSDSKNQKQAITEGQKPSPATPIAERPYPFSETGENTTLLQTDGWWQNVESSVFATLRVVDTPTRGAHSAWKVRAAEEQALGRDISAYQFIADNPEFRECKSARISFGQHTRGEVVVDNAVVHIPQSTYHKCIFNRGSFALRSDGNGGFLLQAVRDATMNALPKSAPASIVLMDDDSVPGHKRVRQLEEQGKFPLFILDATDAEDDEDAKPGTNPKLSWAEALKYIVMDSRPLIRVEFVVSNEMAYLEAPSIGNAVKAENMN